MENNKSTQSKDKQPTPLNRHDRMMNIAKGALAVGSVLSVGKVVASPIEHVAKLAYQKEFFSPNTLPTDRVLVSKPGETIREVVDQVDPTADSVQKSSIEDYVQHYQGTAQASAGNELTLGQWIDVPVIGHNAAAHTIDVDQK